MSKRVNLLKRITPRDLTDYINRRLTSADIAKMYSVSRVYVTRNLPKRAYTNQKEYKQKLRDTRREYRDQLARQIQAKQFTVEEAAKTAGCSTRTMFRHLAGVKNA